MLRVPLPKDLSKKVIDVVHQGEVRGRVRYDPKLSRFIVQSAFLPELIMGGKTFKTMSEAELYAKRITFPSLEEAYLGYCDEVYRERRLKANRELAHLLNKALTNVLQNPATKADAAELLSLIEDFALDGPRWREVETFHYVLCRTYPKRPEGAPEWTPRRDDGNQEDKRTDH